MAQAAPTDPYDFLEPEAPPVDQSGATDPYQFLGIGTPASPGLAASPGEPWNAADVISTGLSLGAFPYVKAAVGALHPPTGDQLPGGVISDRPAGFVDRYKRELESVQAARAGYNAEHPIVGRFGEIAVSTVPTSLAAEYTIPKTLLAGGLAGRIGYNALAGGEAGALQTPLTGGNPLENALTGSLVAGALPVAGAGMRAVVVPKVDPAILANARAAEALGINARPTQIAMSGFARKLDQLLASGGNDKQIRDLTRAASHTFGADTEALTDDALDTAEKNLQTRADAISATSTVNLTPQLNNGMALVSANLKGLSESDQKQVRQTIKEIRSAFTGGTMDGKVYQRLTQRGGPVANLATGSAAVKDAGGKLKELLDDALEAASPPGVRDDWADIRQQFRNFHTIKGIAARNPAGLIDPASLAGKINQIPAGDLRAIARIAPNMPRPDAAGAARAQQHMPWAARYLSGLAAGGEGALAYYNPKAAAIAAAGAGGAAAAGKLTGAAMRSDWYRNMLLQTRPPWMSGVGRPVLPATVGAVNMLRPQGQQ